MVNIEIGELIKELRLKKDMSARELARQSGISQAYLSQIETGSSANPTNTVLKKIAKGLNIHFLELMIKAGYISGEKLALDSESDTYREEIEQRIKNDIDTLNLLWSEGDEFYKYTIDRDTTVDHHELTRILAHDNEVYFHKRLLTEEEKETIINLIELFLKQNKNKNN